MTLTQIVTPKLGVRKATPHEVDVVAALGIALAVDHTQKYGHPNPEVFEHNFGLMARELFKSPYGQVFVSTVEDEIVGFVGISSKKAEICHTDLLFIKAEYQGLGLGRQLMNEAETFAKADGCKVMNLAVWSANVQAQGLYTALGYHVWPNDLGSTSNIIRMAKNL